MRLAKEETQQRRCSAHFIHEHTQSTRAAQICSQDEERAYQHGAEGVRAIEVEGRE